MSKKSSEQKLLAASLSNALNPQKKRGMPREALDQYDDAPKDIPVASATPVTPVTLVTPDTPVTRVTADAAPKRDFTRTANSIVREAVPAGAFTGKGKQLYDYLYSQTRGAIVPVRTARLPTEQVMQCAGMSRPTYRNHINRLIHLGLVEVEERPGEHGGNLFTVYLPEEAGFKRGNRGNTGYRGDTGKNLEGQQGKETYPGNTGLSPDFQRASEIPNTSIKTNTNDDDDVMPLLRSRVGKPMTKTEAVLLALLDTLEARTSVSSHDALLAHVLSQKLAPRGKAPQRQPPGEQFTPPPVAQFTEEELAELRKIEADIRAELSKSASDPGGG